ncbi:MAG: tetratricopeptide repeat protein, partial [Thermodesulfobacteriota bacterium]|nr:tetratricopeptide repeat protein [Thermodesulfobacteriota bacterium]
MPGFKIPKDSIFLWAFVFAPVLTLLLLKTGMGSSYRVEYKTNMEKVKQTSIVKPSRTGSYKLDKVRRNAGKIRTGILYTDPNKPDAKPVKPITNLNKSNNFRKIIKHRGGQSPTKSVLSKPDGKKMTFDPSLLSRSGFEEKKVIEKSYNSMNKEKESYCAPRIKKDRYQCSQITGCHPSNIYHRLVWPEYAYVVYYDSGYYSTFRYVYPYYHRKYIFISFCGYWPEEYRYIRYYWYGCHPYIWYGYYPVAYAVRGDTYNYYTYNYYKDGIETSNRYKVDDIYERFKEERVEKPDKETSVDRYFESAVKAFESGDYTEAADKLAAASVLDPEDIVLPFAYVQALFAQGDYKKAAGVLRKALNRLPPDQEGIFYPRGLYPDDSILFKQIDRLALKARQYPFDADLQ